MKLAEIGSLFKKTFSEWSEDKAPRLAAALSYYTVFSMAPLLVIVIAIAGWVLGSTNVETRIIDQVQGITGSQTTADAVKGMIAGAQNRDKGLIATVIGIATLLFGAAGFFGQLQDALNTVWDVQPKPGGGLFSLIQKRFLSFSMVLGLGFLLLVSLVVSAGLTAFGEWTKGMFPGFEFLIGVFNFVVSFGIITLLFGLIFKILPDAEIAWKDVWLGAAFTAALFLLGQFLIQLYVANSSFDSTFGAAGSLIVILVWVYYSAQILFFGAEFTQVYANQFGSRVVPQAGAQAITEEQRREQGIPSKGGEAGATVASGRAAYPPVAPPIMLPRTGLAAPRREMPMENEPTLFALSTLLAALAGFLTGQALRKRR